MTQYIYPQNLKAVANMWLWSLKDFVILGISALLSIVILVELGLVLPAASTLVWLSDNTNGRNNHSRLFEICGSLFHFHTTIL